MSSPRIVAAEIALPGHSSEQHEVRRAMEAYFEERGDRTARGALEVFERAGVERRFSVLPLGDLLGPRSFAERNRLYNAHALDLARDAALGALAAVDWPPQRIDLVVLVSCTGVTIPSLDAHLANELPLAPGVRRMPITELGCAAGAIGISHAADYLRGRPEQTALVVAVELPSLHFQGDDRSMAHLVSCALFGDGAGAVVLAGEHSPLARAQTDAPRLVDRRSRFFPDTIDYMGFDLRDSGFHMVLDRRIPELVATGFAPALNEFLDDHELSVRSVDHWLFHPGGRRVLESLLAVIRAGDGEPRDRDRRRAPDDPLALSRRVLAEYGNVSSCAVIFVLREFFRESLARRGDRAVMASFGPGFQAEMTLLQWT